MRRPLLVVLALIVLADLAQPLLLGWQPRFVAALGGAAIYTVAAWGVRGGARWALAVVAAMPVTPLATLAAWVAGLPVPVAPSAPMVAIAALQVAAGALAIGLLRSGSPRPTPTAS